MDENEVIKIMREHLESLFPKTCLRCGHCYQSLKEYILTTKPLGSMISYDAETGRWDSSRLIGTVAISDCPCGNTLAVSTEDMPIALRKELLHWIKDEVTRRGISPRELLDYLRHKTRKIVTEERN